jgi:hypothetical protein
LTLCNVIAAMMAQKNDLHIVFGGKNEETSSRENSTPPTGAPKPTLMPVMSQISAN